MAVDFFEWYLDLTWIIHEPSAAEAKLGKARMLAHPSPVSTMLRNPQSQ
jgi:hypothetical protein